MTVLLLPPPQCCDLGYHASLARTLRTYLSAEYSLETSRHEGLDLLEGAVDAMDIRGDKLKVMDMHSQIFCPPTRFDFQPHVGDEVSSSVVWVHGGGGDRGGSSGARFDMMDV